MFNDLISLRQDLLLNLELGYDQKVLAILLSHPSIALRLQAFYLGAGNRAQDKHSHQLSTLSAPKLSSYYVSKKT